MHGSGTYWEDTVRLGPSGPDTPKHKTCNSSTTLRLLSAKRSGAKRSCSGSGHPAPSAPSALQSREDSSLFHKLQPSGRAGGRFYTTPLPVIPKPELLPEAGRGVHLDVAARRRAGFPFLSIRHAAPLSFLHWLRCAAARQRHLRSPAMLR